MNETMSVMTPFWRYKFVAMSPKSGARILEDTKTASESALIEAAICATNGIVSELFVVVVGGEPFDDTFLFAMLDRIAN